MPTSTPAVSEPDPGYACEDAARAALLEAARAMAPLGINHGRAGNVSVRWHRGGADGFLVTPSALAYERCTVDDVVWMSIEPRPAGGGRVEPTADGHRRPSSEWRLHHDLYAHRDTDRAVVHTHATHCTALACLPDVQRRGIPSFHYMVAVAGGADIRCAPYATFGTQALSDHAIAALDGRRACLLAHHGMIATGTSLDAALALAVEVESLARAYALALQLGGPALLPDDEMARVVARFADYRPDRAAD
jgi:L-fuculose-phosphate aldolase